MGCVQNKKGIIVANIVNRTQKPPEKTSTEVSTHKRKQSDNIGSSFNKLKKPRIKSSTVINSRLHKSFLYTKPLFSIATLDQLIKDSQVKKPKPNNPNSNAQNINYLKENDKEKGKTEKGDETNIESYIASNDISYIESKENGIAKIPKEIKLNINTHQINQPNGAEQKKKETQSSFEYTSNDDSTPPKIYRKIEITPYRNVNTIKKFFIYQLKKIYLESKKNDNKNAIKKHDLCRPQLIFSTYSQLTSKEANVYKKFDNRNIQINDYLIYKNKIIGRGRESYVYLGEDMVTKVLYAIKIQSKKMTGEQNEVEILKRLHSKYIVAVYEIIETKNENYIIMELMPNNSLSVNLDNLDIFCVWKYFRNLISAVEYCHEIAKVVHRDISLTNCLIDESDVLKLSNFSSSVMLKEDGTIELNDEKTDKHIFLSPPEITLCTGERKVDGKAIDVWMMGSVLFSLVFGRSFIPVGSGMLTAEDYKIEEKIKCPEDLDLENLMGCLLEPNPEKRYTIDEIKKNKWITKDNEFPMPDVYEEALDYCYKITSEKMTQKKKEIKEQNEDMITNVM